MKTRVLAPLCALSFLLAACAGAQNTDSGNNGTDAAAQDVQQGNDVPSMTVDVPVGADVPNVTDVPQSPTDSGTLCVMLNNPCDRATNNCCEGTTCMATGDGNLCVRAMMCAMGGENCGPAGTACCAGLVCMQRGGAGGMVCAGPMCRTLGQPCDPQNPCCPSGACGGPAGSMMCLATP